MCHLARIAATVVLLVFIPVTASAAAISDVEPAAAEAGFEDVPADHLFSDAVSWLADQGITKGCNPPDNDRFCPDDPVTRGQMAAFLTRTFFLRDSGPSFTDTDGSVFEGDISRLAEAGITRGCNPPKNDRFCPDDKVTRGQMAAFLTRALDLPRADNTFTDDDGHVFEADIAALAAAGITKGCNPPKNDRFCPDDYVTRGQVAAFLRRAFTTSKPAISPVPPQQASIGTPYSLTPTRTGGKAPFTWSATGLPAGLTIDKATGKVTGTPTTVGSYSPKLTVVDKYGREASRTFVLEVVSSGPTITTTSLPDATVGEPYTYQLEAESTQPCCTWSAVGLPDGLSISPSGLISGTPTTEGDYNVHLTATATGGKSDTQLFSLAVRPSDHGGDGGDPGNGEESDIDVEASTITAGWDHTCGLTTTGAAYCWGRNDWGQLGNGDTNTRLVPTPVAGDLTFATP